MASKLQSDTARANGAKSRGPKSPEGKAISSRNALRHGLTARHTLLLDSESEDQFTEFEREFTAIHAPANSAEQDMVNEMIAARWRIQRLRAAQVVVLESEMVLRKAEFESKFAALAPAVHFGLALRTLAEESFCLGHISRHESRLQRDFHRAYSVLRDLQQARKTSVQEPPKPGKPTLHAETKNDETNPGVPPSLQRAVDRYFARSNVAQAFEPVLCSPFLLKAVENAQSPAAALLGSVPQPEALCYK